MDIPAVRAHALFMKTVAVVLVSGKTVEFYCTFRAAAFAAQHTGSIVVK